MYNFESKARKKYIRYIGVYIVYNFAPKARIFLGAYIGVYRLLRKKCVYIDLVRI